MGSTGLAPPILLQSREIPRRCVALDGDMVADHPLATARVIVNLSCPAPR